MGRLTAAAALTAAVWVAAAAGAAAHGYLMDPPVRQWYKAGQRCPHCKLQFWSPMSLNRPGSGTNGATCGGQYPGDRRFEVGGQFATRDIVKNYRSGQVMNTRVQITNNHWGYFQLRLCPLGRWGSSNTAERKYLSEGCFRKHVLKLTTGGTRRWLYQGGSGQGYQVTQSYRLPKGLKCKRCVLQWRYITGHMCRLPGVDDAKMRPLQPGGVDPCPKNYLQPYAIPAEKFIGCADISIR